jgi:hypothetical protein
MPLHILAVSAPETSFSVYHAFAVRAFLGGFLFLDGQVKGVHGDSQHQSIPV